MAPSVPAVVRGFLVALFCVLCASPPAGSAGPVAALPEDGLPMCRITAGAFRMGAHPAEPWGAADEVSHAVTLTRDFWIGETEVTRGQWLRLVARAPGVFAACGPDCPVTSVSWVEAIHFANALSEREGLAPCYRLAGCRGVPGGGCPEGRSKCLSDFTCREVELLGAACSGYRLPTEAEWEFAARAGADTDVTSGRPLAIHARNDAPELDAVAWFGGNSSVTYAGSVDCSGWRERRHEAERCGIHPVRGKLPNRWGLFDTLGNVMEWVQDRAEWDAESRGVVTSTYRDGVVDPLATDGRLAILRGGSWYNFALACRLSERLSGAIDLRLRTVGFRLARTAIPDPQP